jgi:hypothetical protein
LAIYSLKFIQRDKCWDDTDHQFTYIYTFFSPRTKLKYVLRAEYFCTNTFAIKFYAKRDKRLLNKYSRIVNRGDAKNILLTAGKVIEPLLREYPNASFAFAGARSLDPVTNTVESYEKNQRFRIYKELIIRYVGVSTFEQISYDKISCYLLLNKKNNDLEGKRKEIEESFQNTYDELLNVNID